MSNPLFLRKLESSGTCSVGLEKQLSQLTISNLRNLKLPLDLHFKYWRIEEKKTAEKLQEN